MAIVSANACNICNNNSFAWKGRMLRLPFQSKAKRFVTLAMMLGSGESIRRLADPSSSWLILWIKLPVLRSRNAPRANIYVRAAIVE